MRPKLTYANVVATLALFVAVGGASAFAASQLAKNSVGPKQLRKNAVTTTKVMNEAITAAKVEKGSLTGTQINASTLDTVPSAVNAQTLSGLGADQIAQASKLRCPDGTRLVAGLCFETAERPEATFYSALETCAKAGRSLPSVGELATYILSQPTKVTNWAGSQYRDEGFTYAPILDGSSNEVLSAGTSQVSLPIGYRCVSGPTN